MTDRSKSQTPAKGDHPFDIPCESLVTGLPSVGDGAARQGAFSKTSPKADLKEQGSGKTSDS